MVARLRDSTDPALRGQLIHALGNRSTALAYLGRVDEAASIYYDVLAFGDEAIATLDIAAKHFEDKADPKSRVQRVSSLVRKGATLGALERRDEALTALNDVIAQYENDDTGIIPGMIAMAQGLREDLLAEDPA